MKLQFLAASLALLGPIIGGTPADGAGISVYASPNSRGDVHLRFVSRGASRLAQIREILRDSTGCDEPVSANGSRSLTATCRLLHSDGGIVDDQLRLAPLVAALHEAGFVDVSLFVPGNAAEGGWRKSSERGLLQFDSGSPRQTPPPLAVRLGRHVDPKDLIPPLIVVVFIPALLAMWVEMNGPGSAIWLNWLSLAAWFYWISAIDTGNIAAYFGGMLRVNLWAGLVLGALLYAMPPLISVTGCIIALAPRLLPGQNSWGDLAQYLKRSLAGSAAWTVGLGIFLVGSAMFEYDWKIGAGSWLLAYGSYKVIGAWAGQGGLTEMRALDSGALVSRVHELASRAGVQVKRVYLVRNRLSREANAFAFGGGRIGVTEGLLQGLTRREVDAVLAHEIGHLKGGHASVQSSMVWVYYLIAGPLIGYLMTKAGMPEWIRMLPVAPVLATFCMAHLSQRHEFSADARAAELTHDPEAKIAALAQLAKLTRSPLDWGGLQGSIISHPSMRNRVLAIARRCGLAEDRALALLNNPDLLEEPSNLLRPLNNSRTTERRGIVTELSEDAAASRALEAAVSEPPRAAHYALPAELAQSDPLFNTAAKMRFLKAKVWRWEASVVLFLFAWAYAAEFLFPSGASAKRSVLAFFAGLPVVFWAIEYLGVISRRKFLTRMEMPLRERLHEAEGAFIGIMPGSDLQRVEAFGDWDLGFMTLGRDALIFHGERAQFALSRSAIDAIETVKEPNRWMSPRRTVIRWAGGALSLQQPGRGFSPQQARKAASELTGWRDGLAKPAPAEAVSSLPPPLLPRLTKDYVGKGRLGFMVVKKGLKLLVISTILTAFLPITGPVALVPLTAALFVALDALPAFFARRPVETKPVEGQRLPSQ